MEALTTRVTMAVSLRALKMESGDGIYSGHSDTPGLTLTDTDGTGLNQDGSCSNPSPSTVVMMEKVPKKMNQAA